MNRVSQHHHKEQEKSPAQEEIIRISQLCFPEEKSDKGKVKLPLNSLEEINERTKINISMFLNQTSNYKVINDERKRDNNERIDGKVEDKRKYLLKKYSQRILNCFTKNRIPGKDNAN